MYEIVVHKIDIKSHMREKVELFLASFGLALDDDVEHTVIARLDNRIIGTCSYAGKVIKCFAVAKEYQSIGVSERLLTEITNVMFDQGIQDSFIFTRPENKVLFEGFGFKEIHTADNIVLLESGSRDIKRYISKMFKNSNLNDGPKAALVVNCNPFTLGHRYLIQKASEENRQVIVFVVEEDLSLFPFHIRMKLIREGLKNLENVTVLPGGEYIISSGTFPTYFLREDEEKDKAYQSLDAGIFGKYIAPVFNIRKRYLGTEPYSKTTNEYNQAMMSILPKYGVEIVLVDRLEIDTKIVSASTVRQLIKEDRWSEIKAMVPDSTYNYLVSDDAALVLENIKKSNSRH
ncbi:MAG: [citrate (pro-3S)-lyase] ligase [Dethiosulfatibacter sp.]|nr:[citrate (pro-3S)-lyase] ligase [Dethiosulfatibacter sp.]